MKRAASEESGLICKKVKEHSHHHILFLDLNYSSNLLSSKIADIPQKLKYETIIAPIFEYCFGTSDKDIIWEYNEDDYDKNSEKMKKKAIYESNIINLKIDWIRDETFINSQLFNLHENNFYILAIQFGLFNKRKFILSALFHTNFEIVSYCDPLFRSDFEIMMAAVKKHGSNIAYASDELRNNREIVKQSVKQNENAIQYISKEWLDDKEIVMLALESSSSSTHTYNCAPLRLKKDRDVVFKAVSHDCIISYIDNSFNNDRELMMMSLKINGSRTLEFACSELELKKDKEIVLQAIQQDPLAFYSASNELQNDREFVKEIVKKYGKCLGFVSEELQDDKEIVELALKSYPDAIYSISERLRQDIKFISNIIGKRGFVSLPNEFSNDIEIVLESIKLKPRNLELASMELQNDREFILKVVKNCGMAFEFINVKLKSDREIIMEAITQNGDALKFVPFEYFKDEEIIIQATQTATNIHLYEKLSDRLKNDRAFLMKCSSAFYHSFPRKYQLDREIVMEVVKTDPCTVISNAYPMVASERVLAMKIVKRNGLLLGKLPFKYHNDREIVSFAIQQNNKAFNFVSIELKNDLEILKLYNSN